MKEVKSMYSLTKISLYERVADLLEQQILEGYYEEDNKLPSEQALAEQFSVSRTVIRESLKLLNERGLIVARNGMGSFVTKPDPSNLAQVIYRMVVMDRIDYNAVYDVRRALDCEAVRKAVVLATDEQFDQMEAYLTKLKDRSISITERRETDFNFHVAIARASGNKLLLRLSEAMRDILLSMIEKGIYHLGGIDDAIEKHGQILQALRDRDEEAAVRAMEAHMASSRQHVQDFIEGKNQQQPM